MWRLGVLGLIGCSTSLSTPTVVTGGQLDVEKIAASGNDIYWIDAGDASAARVMHASEGLVSIVVDHLYAGPRAIATNGTDVVWANYDGSVSNAGGVLVPPSAQMINSIVMTTDASYISIDGSPGSIAKLASDGTITTAVGNLSSPDMLAVDTVNLYVIDQLDESLYERALAADPTTPPTRLALLKSPSIRSSIITDGTHLYWSDNETVVHAMRLADGTTFDIASDSAVFALGLDDKNLYWVSKTTIERAPLDGGAAETLVELDANGFNAQSIALTTDAVIWADNPKSCDTTIEDCYPTTIESIPKS